MVNIPVAASMAAVPLSAAGATAGLTAVGVGKTTAGAIGVIAGPTVASAVLDAEMQSVEIALGYSDKYSLARTGMVSGAALLFGAAFAGANAGYGRALNTPRTVGATGKAGTEPKLPFGGRETRSGGWSDSLNETRVPFGNRGSRSGALPVQESVRFESGYDKHLSARDVSVKRSKGIGGAHNLHEFKQAVVDVGARIVGRTPHPTLKGVEEIRYQMPAYDRTNSYTGTFRTREFSKTVYDPAQISNEQFSAMGRQAAAEAAADGRLTRQWTGTSENGVLYRGYLNETGAVRSFFPEVVAP